MSLNYYVVIRKIDIITNKSSILMIQIGCSRGQKEEQRQKITNILFKIEY